MSSAFSKISAMFFWALSTPTTSASRSNLSLKSRVAEKRKLYNSGVAGCRMGGELFGGSAGGGVDGGDGGGVEVGRLDSARTGRLRIDGSKTGFGLSATRYSSVSRRLIPAQSEMSISMLSSVRWGARRHATVRLIRLSASAASS